eukprot:gnl/MRDRNA2_/MRDRNA2_123994_c0_seq1.p1 gnl/MRDRNA2_/MRDRNA2_123994_c0~~gnl/MRDRNA2_/MRDRNA2_123994_c0_seq1.p1  ORF type:complete len:704 (+),score=144.45 gnl/MRDRNA2_/MRDRNA2_123994_c0_seq1:121-2232(+)
MRGSPGPGVMKMDMFTAARLREEEKLRKSIRFVTSDDEWDSLVEESVKHCGAFVFFRREMQDSRSEGTACGVISPKFYQLPDVALSELDAPKLLFVEVNVDHAPRARSAQGITLTPTFQLWMHGAAVETFEGVAAAQLQEKVKLLCARAACCQECKSKKNAQHGAVQPSLASPTGPSVGALSLSSSVIPAYRSPSSLNRSGSSASLAQAGQAVLGGASLLPSYPTGTREAGDTETQIAQDAELAQSLQAEEQGRAGQRQPAVAQITPSETDASLEAMYERHEKHLMKRQMEKEAEREFERRRKEAQRRKLAQDALDHAFGGEDRELKELLDEGLDADTCDDYKTSLLSEASAGGCKSTVELLLKHCANVNLCGRWGRSPLWRAAYGGHTELCRILLKRGADTRISDSQGVLPATCAANSRTRQVLNVFDAGRKKDTQPAASSSNDGSAMGKTADESQSSTADADAGTCSICLSDDRAKPWEKLSCGHHFHKSCIQQWFRRANKARCPICRKEEWDKGHYCDYVVVMRDLAEVIFKDTLSLRAEEGDGRWPLVIDPEERATAYFKYSGAVVVDILQLHMKNANDREKELYQFRRGLLTALKRGGAVVFDMRDMRVDVSALRDLFDPVERGFIDQLLLRRCTDEYLLSRRFLSLVRKEEQHEFSEWEFIDEYMKKFVLAFVTHQSTPHMSWLDACCVLRVAATKK